MAFTLPIASTWQGEPLPPGLRSAVQLASGGPEHLLLRVVAPAAGDPPPEGPPGPTDGLWNHEVVEWFCAGAGAAYVEIELGPHGHHCALQLSGIRERAAGPLPLEVHRAAAGRWWAAEARVPRAWIPEGPHRANAYRIAGPAFRRSFLAHAAVPGPTPDFHQPDRFVAVTLPTEPTDPVSDLTAAVLALRPPGPATALLGRVATLLRGRDASWCEAAAALAASLLIDAPATSEMAC